VAVVAPAGPFDRESFEAGLRVLAARYRVVVHDSLFARSRYLAGDDPRRLDELTAALADESVKAVVAARGGYGVLRLLARLGPKLAGLVPKPLVGFSDITALHLALQAAGWVSIHGPVVTQLGTQPPDVAARLFHLLESPDPAPPLRGTPMVAGLAEGPLVGGNLSLLTRLLGTPYLPPLDGAVLLLEDVGERPYRLDRMWTHLALAGVFDRVCGLALGEFTDCEEPNGDYRVGDVLAELVAEVGLPSLGGLPIGHGAVNQPVPLGARVRLDAVAGALEFLEPVVAPP
jgi:muramoyltetrapeptide carboxypeptidase